MTAYTRLFLDIMVIYVLKTVIFRCIYEHPRIVYPLGDCTFKVVFFHAKFDDLGLTFPNLCGKLNFWGFVESIKK